MEQLVAIWGRSVSNMRNNTKCKGPEAKEQCVLTTKKNVNVNYVMIAMLAKGKRITYRNT